jgi:hypothetical protein
MLKKLLLALALLPSTAAFAQQGSTKVAPPNGYQTLNARDFGAIPNDSIDDTDELLAMLTVRFNSRSVQLYFPSGDYNFTTTFPVNSATLSVKDIVSIVGA